MTDAPIERLNLLDTDYAEILANSSQPAFLLQLINSGIDAAEARVKLKFLKLVRHKPETPEEWEALTAAWEEACGFKPRDEHFELISMFLWEPDPEQPAKIE